MDGHKQTTDSQNYTTAYAYNLSGAIIEQTYPSGRVVKNVFDGEGDLAQVQSKKNASEFYRNYATSFVYNATGAVTSLRLGNGRFETTQYNSRLQPTQIGLGASTANHNLLKLNYEYGTTDNNGNVKSQVITVPTVGANQGFIATQTYSYDSLNRISQATENIAGQTSWNQTFSYDRYGNRNFVEGPTTTLPKLCNGNTTVCPADVPKFNPSVNTANNRLNGYVFDLAGNTTIDADTRAFTYDAENKQVQVNDGQTIIGQYAYDGEGQRVRRYIPAANETTILVYNTVGLLVAEYSTTPTQSSDAKSAYLTSDYLGSPRILTDEYGQLISRRDFHPFGEEVSTVQRTANLGYANDEVRRKFTSYDRDYETGLDFAQARMYSSQFGRFSTPDMPLIAQEKSNPQTFNLVSYCLNNPLSITDPSGRRWYYQLDKENKALSLVWVNPNDDGSYTAPEGEGWQAYIPPEGGGMMFLGGDRFNAFYIGEDENGAPITRSLASGATLPSDEDLLPMGALVRGTGSILRSIGQAALAKWLFKEGVEQVTRLTAKQIGDIGEEALKKYLGNLGGKRFFNTTAGRRFVDYFVDTAAHEAKTGHKTLTKFIRQQILKDKALLSASEKEVTEVTWHFIRSPVTGMIGPNAPLRKALTDAGIKINFID